MGGRDRSWKLLSPLHPFCAPKNVKMCSDGSHTQPIAALKTHATSDDPLERGTICLRNMFWSVSGRLGSVMQSAQAVWRGAGPNRGDVRLSCILAFHATSTVVCSQFGG